MSEQRSEPIAKIEIDLTPQEQHDTIKALNWYHSELTQSPYFKDRAFRIEQLCHKFQDAFGSAS